VLEKSCEWHFLAHLGSTTARVAPLLGRCHLPQNGMHRRNHDKQDVRHTFPAMTLYLEDKEAFFNMSFKKSSLNIHARLQATIKEAMTALGFGAKLSQGTWRSDAGEESQSSLFEVFDKDKVSTKTLY
jgi:hypothetical protein